MKKPDKLIGDNAKLSVATIERDYCAMAKSEVTPSQNLVDSNLSSLENMNDTAKERKNLEISERKVKRHVEEDGISKTRIGTTANEKQMPDKESMEKGELVKKEVASHPPVKTEELAAIGDRVSTIMNFKEYCTCGEQHRSYNDSPIIMNATVNEENRPNTLRQKIVIFFDLDLLRDFTYVNLLMGVTLGNFAELNFSILIPFVLADWNFAKQDIATFLSILGGVDISVRFFIPFIAGKIGWENKTFYLVGIMGMAMGRVCK